MLTEAPLHRVTTRVVIDADVRTVWRNVIEFPDLSQPVSGLFTIGVAYPIRARIEGKGVGAIRYCEFSTGPFVEPITIWDENRLLRFDVTHNPPPMRELSFHDNVDPPHLHGFMESHQGQFELNVLPDGRVELVGTTWYTHRLWPQTYWLFWSDYIIHQIHARVLNHIKELSESDI